MHSYFTVVRELLRNKLMRGQTEIQEMLDEVLSMTVTDNMELKAYFVYNNKLYITFEEDKSIIDDMIYIPRKKLKESYGKKHVPQSRKKSRKS